MLKNENNFSNIFLLLLVSKCRLSKWKKVNGLSIKQKLEMLL